MTSTTPGREHRPPPHREPSPVPRPGPASSPGSAPLPPQVVGVGADSRAVASLVIGVVAVLLSWVPLLNALSLVTGVLATALGALALRGRCPRCPSPPSSRRLAVAGICCGTSALLVVIAVMALFTWWVWAMDHGYVSRLT